MVLSGEPFFLFYTDKVNLLNHTNNLDITVVY